MCRLSCGIEGCEDLPVRAVGDGNSSSAKIAFRRVSRAAFKERTDPHCEVEAELILV